MNSAHSKITHTILIAAAGLLLALGTPTAATAQSPQQNSAAQPLATVSGGCAPTALRYVTVTTGITTTSTSFVTVSGTTINFVQGGTTAKCVIVSFSAMADAVASNVMIVQAVLDGNTIIPCQPGATDFAASFATATPRSAHTMNFVCPNVAPGNHSIKMQYVSVYGGAVSLDHRTMIVHYVP